MLEALFKYDPAFLRRGTIELSWPWSTYVWAVLALALIVALALGYAKLGGGRTPVERIGLGTIRTGLLGALLLILLEPILVVSVEEPRRGHVVVLLDDSRSMAIADHDDDWGGGAAQRIAFIKDRFGPGAGNIARKLEARFTTHFYRFSGTTESIESENSLSASHPRTDIANALNHVREALSDTALSAVVLVSDGADASLGSLEIALLKMRARGTPVHTVGVGVERYPLDLEIAALPLPKRVLPGDTLHADLVLSHRGLDGKEVRLTVENEGSVIYQQPVTIEPDRPSQPLRVPIVLNEPGPNRLEFRVDPVAGELVRENNLDVAVVNVAREKIDVLHFEGEPRFEVKFLRRAIADDASIRLVSMVRTAENKFYRLGVKDADELAGGFPVEPKDLFTYRALVLGSVEATALTAEQQQHIVDFVSRRGGGLLLLGGSRAFAAGGYAGSPLIPLLPVVLPEPGPRFRAMVQIRPTEAGLAHPLTQFETGSGEMGEMMAWPSLPTLTMVNPIRIAKPGATILLQGINGADESLVALAYHRYGRGTVAVLPVRDTWRWQMHRDIPVEDQTHELFWRRLLRWLSRPAAGRIAIDTSPDHVAPGDSVRVWVEVRDDEFRPLTVAGAKLQITSPLGDERTQSLSRTAGEGGTYVAKFVAHESGRYELKVQLPGVPPATAGELAIVEVTPHGRELHRSELRRSLLERIAERTGGRYFPAREADGIADAIESGERGRIITRRLPLWDMPAIFLVIFLLAGTEWLLRRRWKLA